MVGDENVYARENGLGDENITRKIKEKKWYSDGKATVKNMYFYFLLLTFDKNLS